MQPGTHTYAISVHITDGTLPDPGFVYLPRDPSEVEVEIEGETNGETLTLEAGNDGATWEAATRPDGEPVALSSDGVVEVATLARAYRPIIPTGAGVLLLTLRMR